MAPKDQRRALVAFVLGLLGLAATASVWPLRALASVQGPKPPSAGVPPSLRRRVVAGHAAALIGVVPREAHGALVDVAKLDAARVNTFLNGVRVLAVTDETGAVCLEQDNAAGRSVGRFYLQRAAAEEAFARIRKEREGVQKIELREIPLSDVYLPLVLGGEVGALGGELRVEPPAKEVRHARQILEGGSLGPAGSVPLFMASELELQDGIGGDTFVPAFLYEDDLRKSLKRAGAKSQAAGGPRVQLTTLQTITEKLKQGTNPLAIRLIDSSENVRDLTELPPNWKS